MRVHFNSVKRQIGFTLIEILTVVLLISIVMGGVSVFISQEGPEKQLDKTVERFVVISEHVSELAILGGEPIGLLLEPPEWRENPLDEGWRYSWQVLRTTEQGDMWQTLNELEPVEIDNVVELSVYIDEQRWKFKNAPKVKQPIAAFYPTGEVDAFEIEFTSDDVPGESETVMVDVWGQIVWKERQELEDDDF